MSLGFPTNPNLGDTYVLGTRTYVWNGTAWAIQTQNASVVTVITATIAIITTSTQSTSTNTGGLIVTGGVGVGGSINAGNTSTVLGAEIITTATLNNYVLQPLFVAGTGTAITTSTQGGFQRVTIWSTATLQTVTNSGATTTNRISILNTSTATSVGTGALVVGGGASIAGDLWLSGTIYSAGVPVITTSSLGQAIYAGTDIRITTTGSSGILVIDDISTLQSVTDRGTTTTNIVHFSNTTNSTSSSTGAVVISGGLGVAGRINTESIQIADAIMDSGLVLVNTVDTTVIDAYSIDDYRSSKYIIQISDGTGPSANFEVIEILLLLDNSGTVYATEYAVLSSNGELGEFAADVQGDNMVRLYFTAYQATNKVIKTLRTAMRV
jgi:hypothetical protein